MQSFAKGLATTALVGLAVTGIAEKATAATIVVTTNVGVSTTWTAGNTYQLAEQIYVLPGATLTIEAGATIASVVGGSLAVTRGAQIHALGTTDRPVVMTSVQDRATWTAGNPATGMWREADEEWGNLTLMGQAYISENDPNIMPPNTPTPAASNFARMEGLIGMTSNDPNVTYGGGNDDDDSGTIRFVSLRYGGTVVGLTVELNGLSLGGIGRGTDIQYVEIMNNVDDGMEIWGGTVNIKNFAIWNIGDDSFDVDQGWRGKAQFGLIVQGWSDDASQGSGVGDNCFETDGAENSWWQPVTTTSIYNCTVIGQPVAGDNGTDWRDNARVQYRNCIFMDLGDRLVKFSNIDGDGGAGYGANGSLSWPATWTTDYNAVPAYPPSDAAPGTTLYQAQTDGKLAEIKSSLFFRNTVGTDFTTSNTGTTGDPAYDEALARGVFAPANNNQILEGQTDANLPIAALVRGPVVTKGGLDLARVITLDPRPVGPATTSIRNAPADGFFSEASYVGAFKPTNDPQNTWLSEWTAADAYGIVNGKNTPVGTPTCFGDGSAGPCACDNLGGPGEGCAHGFSSGVGTSLTASGTASISNDSLVLTARETSNQPALFFQGNNSIGGGVGVTFGDGLRCCGQNVVRLQIVDPPGGAMAGITISSSVSISDVGTNPVNLGAGDTRCYQYWYRTPGVWNSCGNNFNFSNSYIITWGA